MWTVWQSSWPVAVFSIVLGGAWAIYFPPECDFFFWMLGLCGK